MSGPTVELMRTLDEKFLASEAAFAGMRPTGAVLVDAAPFLDAAGDLDPAPVRAAVADLVRLFPPLRMRLRTTPLALTTPAWVPCDVDLDEHLRFPREPRVEQMLAGARNGPMRRDRPLWSVAVMRVGDERVAFVPQIQHALGDGLFGLRVIDALSAAEPWDLAAGRPEPTAELPAVPGSGAGILLAAFREWRARQTGAAGAWREYWRKPFDRRLRRWAGRALRTSGLRPIPPAALPERAHGHAVVEFARVKRVARAEGLSVHDLTVAAALEAVARHAPVGGRASLLVPISRRAGATGDERNNISMTRVSAPADVGWARFGEAVRDAVAAAAAGESAVPVTRDWPGYASFLPYRPRRRHVGPALVRSVVLWPVLEPGDTVAVFGSSYADEFTVSVSGVDDDTVSAVLASVLARVGGPPDAAGREGEP